jgi:hypothetical protein
MSTIKCKTHSDCLANETKSNKLINIALGIFQMRSNLQ